MVAKKKKTKKKKEKKTTKKTMIRSKEGEAGGAGGEGGAGGDGQCGVETNALPTIGGETATLLIWLQNQPGRDTWPVTSEAIARQVELWNLR